MAPGIFGKIGDFFKKGYEFVKEKIVKPVVKVAKKVYQKVVRPVWEVAKPIAKTALQAFGASKGMDPNLTGALVDVGEGLADNFLGEKPPDNSPSYDTSPAVQEVEEEIVYVDENGNPISEAELRSGKYEQSSQRDSRYQLEQPLPSIPIKDNAVDLMRRNIKRRK
jgi:hypothetical protein